MDTSIKQQIFFEKLFLCLNLFKIFMELKENLDESFLNLLFPENDDDGDENAINGDSGDDASSDGMNDDIESNAELTPGNTTDEEYERKYVFKSSLRGVRQRW